MHQIKGHLRDHRQRREAYPVAELIARVKKALDKKKAKDGERKTSEVAHESVQRQIVSADLQQHDPAVDKVTSDMVDKH